MFRKKAMPLAEIVACFRDTLTSSDQEFVHLMLLLRRLTMTYPQGLGIVRQPGSCK